MAPVGLKSDANKLGTARPPRRLGPPGVGGPCTGPISYPGRAAEGCLGRGIQMTCSPTGSHVRIANGLCSQDVETKGAIFEKALSATSEVSDYCNGKVLTQSKEHSI